MLAAFFIHTIHLLPGYIMLVDHVDEFGEIVVHDILIECLGTFWIEAASLPENHVRVPEKEKLNPPVAWSNPTHLLDMRT